MAFARVLAAVLLLGACANSDTDDDDAPVDCSTQVADTFTVGLDHQGAAGRLDFAMMSAAPAPPARGNNTWVVQIMAMTDGSDTAPMTDAEMTVTPYMPAHGHGTPVTVDISGGSDGQYTLSPVNLWMPGVWQTTIAVTSPISDSAVFTFCLPD